jgi:hypothetical protein
MGNCNKTYECEKCKELNIYDDDEFVPLPYIHGYVRKKQIVITKQDLYKIYNDEIDTILFYRLPPPGNKRYMPDNFILT